MNPLAVELAKLSLWLTTLAKGRPFGFLDHNLKSGDSLLGISNLEQLIQLDMNPKQSGQLRLFGRSIRKSVEQASELRSRLREIPMRDITDVEAMARLDGQSRRILDISKLFGDAFIGGIQRIRPPQIGMPVSKLLLRFRTTLQREIVMQS